MTEALDSQAPTPVAVVAAVIFDGDLVLACRRKPGLFFAGQWEFPGGKVEPGETFEAALHREIREELDTAIVIEHELSTETTRSGDRLIALTCYRTRLADEPPEQSTDHDLMRWILLDDLDSLEWALPDRPVVEHLKRSHSD